MMVEGLKPTKAALARRLLTGDKKCYTRIIKILDAYLKKRENQISAGVEKPKKNSEIF